ncbi:MAG TPA: HAMP domain-containing sensor histidine kinase, partial [Candidatus Limnocylindrales bacterium]|nr:HAMP domain-containing sensor histidine kinase [Candidatus Limnocylindrales bacterium]
MADGVRVDPGDDAAEQAAQLDEGRLLRRTRWRLVAWSGLSTLGILALLAIALYTVTARTLESASVTQLEQRTEAITRFLQGPPDGGPGQPGDELGFLFGNGNTLLYLFDDNGDPVWFGDRRQIIPAGLPEPDGVAAAESSATGQDVRLTTLTISGRGQPTVVPIRILTRRVEARDGNTYTVQAIQDRSTEVGTLDALLAVLLIGGGVVLVVSFGFGALYARRALVPIRASLEAQRTALRRQREFAADASHELRTPLAVIRSSVEHLGRHRDRPLGESAEALEDIDAEALDDIDAEVSHLVLLVDDLLLLARSDSGAVPMDRVALDLGDVAFDAAGSLGRMAEDRGVRVEVDPEPAMLDGDPVRIRQLVTILVDNAIRHSPRGGAVAVRVRVEGSVAALEVSDQGPGLRPEDMPHVFDRFYRAPGAPSGGTGLGLAIARWVVERHGGRIGVRNGETVGAIFRAELPAGSG